MLHGLRLECETCETPLGDRHHHLTLETAEGARSAYECDCGAVTITVGRPTSA